MFLFDIEKLENKALYSEGNCDLYKLRRIYDNEYERRQRLCM